MDKMLRRSLVLVTLFLGCLITGGVEAAILEVGLSGYPYTSIQAAIDAAVPGDTVLVHDGTYVENITFSGKAITVKSVNGAARTIIDGNGSGSVVTFSSGEGSGSVLDGFTIKNGNGGWGGGIRCYSSSPTITNCIISGNAAYAGAGICCESNSSPTITSCTISGNGAYLGGGVYCKSSSSPTITSCTISGNTGTAHSGGIGCDAGCSPIITNCIISGNTAGVGGGVYSYLSSPTIINSTISGNTTSNGGGIYCESNSSSSVKNSILWGDVPNEIYLVAGSSITVTYSDVNQDGYEGSNGNIRQNPLFVDPTNGNFRLQLTSPCIDAATSDGAPLTDMKGNPRFDPPWIPNTGGGTYPYYDMGALELAISKPMVDFDGDGSTDVAAFHLPSDQFFTDYAGNLGQYGWGGSDCYPLVWDYNGNGATDISIYHIPTNQWFVKGVPGDNLGAFGWGEDESVPVPGDYNGDGVIERAFYHWPTNRWFVEGAGGSFTAYDFGWGGADCIPIALDYDGNGTTDMMLYHIPSNQWFVYGIGNLGQFGWNGSECIPVPGDWDGDGEIDLAVYHWPSNEWIWRDKSGTAHFLGQYGWGGMASFPIPGDYNGDGIMERAFYRPSENRWFIEGKADFYWGWGGSDFMPITSQITIYNWFRFVLGMFQ